MTKEQVIEKLVQPVKGELSPIDWLQWFEKYKDSIEGICGRLRFLKMKPKESFSEIRNTYLSQITAYEWLKSIKITIDLSDNYKNDWEKEFENFVISKQKKTKNLKKQLKRDFNICNLFIQFYLS